MRYRNNKPLDLCRLNFHVSFGDKSTGASADSYIYKELGDVSDIVNGLDVD